MERVMVALATAGAVVALMVVAHAVHRHPVVRSVLLASAAGIAFGVASVFTKTVAVDLDASVPLTGQLPSLAVIAVLAAAGVLISQASYRGAGLAAPLSTVTVINPVVAATVGLTLFGESFRYGTAGTVIALGFGIVAAGGLILLTTERIGAAEVAQASSVPVAKGGPVAAPELQDFPEIPAVPASGLRADELRALPSQPVAGTHRRVLFRHGHERIGS
jgi:hypothetical protein